MKQAISLAPNNASAWNYLRGILEHTKTPFSSVADFVTPYTLPYDGTKKDIVDVDTPGPGPSALLPCPAAIEFMADMYEQSGDKEGALKASEVCHVYFKCATSPTDVDIVAVAIPRQ